MAVGAVIWSFGFAFVKISISLVIGFPRSNKSRFTKAVKCTMYSSILRVFLFFSETKLRSTILIYIIIVCRQCSGLVLIQSFASNCIRLEVRTICFRKNQTLARSLHLAHRDNAINSAAYFLPYRWHIHSHWLQLGDWTGSERIRWFLGNCKAVGSLCRWALIHRFSWID